MTSSPDVLPETTEERHRGNRRLAIQALLGFGGFVIAVAIASRLFKEPLQAICVDFVRHFGAPGIALGVFVSDAVFSPIPPQFFMLASITTHQSPTISIGVVCIATVIAGHVGRVIGLTLGERPFFLRLLGRSRAKADVLFRRYGFWAVAVGSVTPFPYSTLCHLAGLYRVPLRQFALFSLLRVPRILFYYWVLRAGFG